MQVWIAFAVGAFIGSAVTVLLIGLCQAAGDADRASERFADKRGSADALLAVSNVEQVFGPIDRARWSATLKKAEICTLCTRTNKVVWICPVEDGQA